MDTSFWDNKEYASKILRKISRIEKEITTWNDLKRKHDDIEVLFEFVEKGEVEAQEVKKN